MGNTIDNNVYNLEIYWDVEAGEYKYSLLIYDPRRLVQYKLNRPEYMKGLSDQVMIEDIGRKFSNKDVRWAVNTAKHYHLDMPKVSFYK